MFSQCISRTPLTHWVSNSAFGNITSSAFEGDLTFCATMRALLQSRIKDDENINVAYRHSSHSERDLRSNAVEVCFNAVCVQSNPGFINIHNFCRSDDASNRAWMIMVKSEFQKRVPDSISLDHVANYFKSIRREVLCFASPESKTVWLFVEKMDLKLWHGLQIAIPAFLPWYFNLKNGECLGDLEKELLESLRENTPNHYLACLNEIAKQYDFYEQNVRTLLRGFEHKFEEMELRRINDLINEYMREISYLQDQISEKLRFKRDADIRALGLTSKIGAPQDGDSELMELFLQNDHLILEDASNDSMTFVVKSYLAFFDEDEVEVAIANRNGYLYRPGGRDVSDIISPDDMEMLMKAVFVDQTIKARFCGAFTFYLSDLKVRAPERYEYPADCNASYTPNPHLDGWGCIGSGRGHIEQALANGDYVLAIQQCVASCSNLNFSDGIVMAEFARRIYGTSDYKVNIQFLELPDGSVVEPKQAIQWLKEQREASDNG